MVRHEFPEGETQWFEGEQDEERLVRQQSGPDGPMRFFEGEQGEEREVDAPGP